jgi:hypothetical protein
MKTSSVSPSTARRYVFRVIGPLPCGGGPPRSTEAALAPAGTVSRMRSRSPRRRRGEARAGMVSLSKSAVRYVIGPRTGRRCTTVLPSWRR